MKRNKYESTYLDVKTVITPLDYRNTRDFSVYMSFKDRLKLIFRLLTQKYPWFMISKDRL